MIKTIGWLESITISGDTLIVGGWVAALTDGTVKNFVNFVVYANGKTVPVAKCTTGLPSPDVKTVYPNLAGTEHCRFILHIPLDKEDTKRLNSSVLLVCPILEGTRGCALGGLTQNSAYPMPSEEDINFIGGGIGVGLEFFDYFMKYCNLQPSDSVLDVGCGIGRMAFPLTAYLSTAGRYEGFDIYDSGITWAKENITPLYPNFNFQKANIFNKLYNPHGRVVSSEFAFPYSDAYFDFVYLTSVFTHMYPDDVRQYLKEISRVIKRGSKCLLTCFLLNTESIKFIQNGNSTLRLVHKINGCFTADKKIPEKAIGFHENDLLKWISEQKLIVAQTLYGSWCGRKDFTSYQDILIIEKPDDASK